MTKLSVEKITYNINYGFITDPQCYFLKDKYCLNKICAHHFDKNASWQIVWGSEKLLNVSVSCNNITCVGHDKSTRAMDEEE